MSYNKNLKIILPKGIEITVEETVNHEDLAYPLLGKTLDEFVTQIGTEDYIRNTSISNKVKLIQVFTSRTFEQDTVLLRFVFETVD